MNEETRQYLDLLGFEDALTSLTNATDPADVALIVQTIRESYSSLFVQAEAALKETEVANEKYIKTIKALGELSARLSTAPVVASEVVEDKVEEVVEDVEETLDDLEDEEDYAEAFI